MTTTTTRRWRKTRQTLKGRAYWSLQAGARGKGRVALALGYVTEDEAETALQAMQDEEMKTCGTPYYDRILRLYKKDKQAARDYLQGDSAIEALFGIGAVEPNWKHLSLREYVDNHYGPHREATKPKTWRTERGHWNLIHNAIGDRALGDVDEFLVDEFLTEKLRRVDGGQPSANMQRQCRNAIRAMLTWARRKRHYQKPLPQFFRLEGTGPKVRHGEDEYLSLDDADCLLTATRLPMHRTIFASAIGLCLRPNEASRMRWEDIDFEAGRLTVRGTKTDASHAVVPLLPIARGALQAWWVASGEPTDGPCFVSERGKPYSTRGGHVGWRKALTTAIEKAGITKRVTPYSLRHAGASILVEHGIPMASVAKMLRHTNPRMLEQHYDHTGATKAPGLVALAPTLPAG